MIFNPTGVTEGVPALTPLPLILSISKNNKYKYLLKITGKGGSPPLLNHSVHEVPCKKLRH